MGGTVTGYVYEVRDVDGTSFTGVSKLVGLYLDPEKAQAAADAVNENDAWHTGYVTKHRLKG
jgi:hypothetical protein